MRLVEQGGHFNDLKVRVKHFFKTFILFTLKSEIKLAQGYHRKPF